MERDGYAPIAAAGSGMSEKLGIPRLQPPKQSVARLQPPKTPTPRLSPSDITGQQPGLEPSGMFIGAGAAPRWPDWIDLLSTDVGAEKTPSESILNAVQASVEQNLQVISADNRKLGPAYGPCVLAGRVDIFKQIGTYIYIRALFCIGEIQQISAVRINGGTYLTGDPTGDPDYIGDWEDSAVWTGLGGLPYSASAGEIWLYGGAYFETNQDFTITNNTGSYTPADAYAAYFDPMVTNATINVYTGSTTQSTDPILSAVGGDLIGYQETLTGSWGGAGYGIAYVVVRIKATEYTGGFPRVSASLNGAKVYDPRTGKTEYSTNPALCLADFMASPLYGLNASVDMASISAAAEYCDAVFSDGARIQIGLAIAPRRPDRTIDWVETLRAYALCWLHWQEGVYYLVVDGPTSSSGDIRFDQGTEADPELADLPSLATIPLRERPNRIRIFYTDNNRTESVEVETAAVTAETEFPRELELRMPGLFTEAMAERYAQYRLLLAQSELWALTFPLFDAGLRVTPGQVWSITSPNIGTQTIRIVSQQSGQLGDYVINARQYSSAVYS